jgi:hypothetical protein
VPCCTTDLFNVHEYRSRKHDIVENESVVERKPHTLKCLAVTGMKNKLDYIKLASFFNVPLDYFQNNVLE